MPTYRIQAPGGAFIRVTGDKPPSKTDLDQIFIQMGADRSVEGAMSGAEARSGAPDPMSAEGFYGGRGPDNELVTSEFANTQATVGGGLALAAAPFMVPARAGGAIAGGQEAYRRTDGNIPATLGGAAGGAALPGVAMGGSAIAAAADYAGGGTAGNVTAAGLTAGVASLMLRRYGLAGAAKKVAGLFGDMKTAERALTTTAKSAPAAVKLDAARKTLSAVDEALTELGWSEQQIAAHTAQMGKAVQGAETVSPALPGVIPKLDPQALIPGGVRFTAEETAGMVARARANEAAAAARRAAATAPAPKPMAAAPLPASTADASVLEFAKEAAKERGIKMGEKIWIELGPHGEPLRVLANADKARGAARAGKKTTFVKNLWTH